MQIIENNTELDKEYIIHKIQEVVINGHTDTRKHKIKVFKDRINTCCPYCQDSVNPNKRRGNLYFKNLMFKCFNEGCHASFIKLCNDFRTPVEMDKKLQIYEYIDNNITYQKDTDDFVINSLDKLINLTDMIKFFDNSNNKLKGIMPVQKNSRVYHYLKSRYINNFTNIYQAEYHFTEKWVEPVMVLLNQAKRGDDYKVIGIQLRNLKDGKDDSKPFEKRFFKIYDFSEIYNLMNPDEHLDQLEAISYNKLSHFYNIFNVNFDSKVTVFEGYLDSLFNYPSNSSIGVIGVNTDMKFLLSNEDLQLQFFYDNDEEGLKHSIEKLKDGYPVFLWEKLFEHIISKKKDKYKAKQKLIGIKDLNKLVIESKNPDIYQKLKLNEYFSKDDFDQLYLVKN